MTMPPKPPGYYTDKLFTCDDMDKAIQKEREECAKICDEFEYNYWRSQEEQEFTPIDCAKAIRARGQE